MIIENLKTVNRSEWKAKMMALCSAKLMVSHLETCFILVYVMHVEGRKLYGKINAF